MKRTLIYELQQTSAQLQKDVMTADFEVKSLRSEVDTIQKWFTNDTCPTCNRKLDRTADEINAKTIQREILLQNITKKEDEKAAVNAKFLATGTQIERHKEIIKENNEKRSAELSEAEKDYQNSIKDVKEAIEKLKAEQTVIKTVQKTAKEQAETLNSKISTLQSQIAVLGEQKNSTDAKLKEIQSQAEQYKKEVEGLESQKGEIQKEIIKLEKKKTYAKFFYDSLGPKGAFRGVLLAKDIAYINECLKVYIPKFFLGAELYLTTPSIDKATIDLVFEEDGVRKPVSNLSSGERKRVNISIQLAIYDLLQSTSLFNFNLCIFDEIESALDPEGVRQLLEIIDDRQDNFQTAWWITNNEMVSSNILNKIVAKKQNGFTKVEYA